MSKPKDETAGTTVDRAEPSADETPPPQGEDAPAPEATRQSIVEALLLSTDRPLSATRMAQILDVGSASDVKDCINALNERYVQWEASFRIELIANGYQILTLPAFDRWVRKLHKSRADSRFSSAALESLAIIAYKQPVLRADVEAIRGVAVGDMLIRLRDMNLVRIVGRAEEVGRPLLYGTTTKFLDIFGLQSLKDLPPLDPDRPDEVPRLADPTHEVPTPEVPPLKVAD